MPSLICLRILPRRPFAHPLLSFGHCNSSNTSCNLLSLLRPQRLVIGGPYCQITGLGPINRFIPTSVQRITVLVANVFLPGWSRLHPNLTGIYSQIPDNLKVGVSRLTFVVMSRISWETYSTGWDLPVLSDAVIGSWDVNANFRKNLAWACCGRSATIEVVGMEARSDVVNPAIHQLEVE